MSRRLQAPIVLAHGLLGFARMAVRGITLATYFQGIPEHLEKAGNRVNLTAVPPTGSIAARAEALRREIRGLCGDEPVHIIAHSMGGLDARHMITHLDMASRVLSLTTLGTPHRGSSFADRAVAMAEEYHVFDWLRRSPIAHEAFEELRTEACARSGTLTPDVPSVRYFSVAGQKRREEMFYALRFSHDVILPAEGPNDGLVSVRSAQWGESCAVWDCDHINMVGWTGPREQLAGYTWDVRNGYDAILRQLSECGF